MPAPPRFSPWLTNRPEAKNPDALARIALAKTRVQSVLDREGVSHQKTLEQKISEQGPTPIRVDPHLVGLAIRDLLELRRLRSHRHPTTSTTSWYANPGTPDSTVKERLDALAPLYATIAGSTFGNLVGDALEIIVFKCLREIYARDPRYAFQGTFNLDAPKTANGRYHKVQPPKIIGPHRTEKEADFLQFGYASGPLCIECKNYREWIYPHHEVIKKLIEKASDLHVTPVLIARRLHYTTRTNFLEPAGILAHETYFQYYPPTEADLAAKVKHKRSLGFTDVTAADEPHTRTTRFFTELLPKITDGMAERWKANRTALVAYARGDLNLAQLYTEIDSPAGGKWQDFSENGPSNEPESEQDYD